ncbi:MAG: hypothetical protein FJ100_03050, partial [Deltaproteobacteria bacterium]|nr:hypothetical protein [Deltaproteobacteria bacterium]
MATLPGLVEVTAAELRSLGLRPSPARGGVQAELPAGSLSKLLSLLRTPEQLLIEFGQADVAGVAGLGDLAQALRATGWLV